MAPVTITVRGSFESFHPPERATVYLTAGHEGPEPDAVYRATSETTTDLGERITALFDRDAGPVTWWSSDQISTWSERPWNQDGKQLPFVHHATVGFQVTFSDFAELGRWLAAVAPEPGVAVQRIKWALTEGRRDELTRHARQQAVLDARTKATTYADAVGVAELVPVAIADVGMLGDQEPGNGGRPPAAGPAMFASRTSGGPELRLAPEDIVISATVDARFLAR